MTGWTRFRRRTRLVMMPSCVDGKRAYAARGSLNVDAAALPDGRIESSEKVGCGATRRTFSESFEFVA